MKMRVLIQDDRNKRYSADAGKWVEDARAGRNFGSHPHASEAARQTRLPEFYIVLNSARIKLPYAVGHGSN